MTSKRYLQTLTWLRRRLKSNKPINDPNYSPRYQQFLKIMKKKLEKARPRFRKLGLIEPVYAADDHTVLAEFEWNYFEVEIGKIRFSIARRGRQTS